MSSFLQMFKWIFLTITFCSSGNGLRFYPFGSNVGDRRLTVKDDHTSQAVPTAEFPFFGKNFTALHVNENGIIFFGAVPRVTSLSPFRFPLRGGIYAAAPYWADVYTKRGGNVWYRVTRDNATVASITRDIQRAFPRDSGFTSSWAAIVTWNEVTFYSALGIYTQKKNTFQVVIASDGYMTFVGYLYDKLSWTTGSLNGGNQGGLGGNQAKVGFSYGDSSYEINVSGTSDVLTLATKTNCGQRGVFFFRVDGVQRINDEICDSKGSISFYPSAKSLQSGTNVFVSGLCYRPDSDFLCDFGEAGIIKAHKLTDSKAVCSVPFMAIKKETEISFYSSERDLYLTKVLNLDPVNLTKSFVKLREYPTAWTAGSRVKITWDPTELADQPVTVQIINLVINQFDIVQPHSNISVVKEQENTGKAEFDLPHLAYDSQNGTLGKNQLQIIRVQSIVGEGYKKYAEKHWIWSDLFLFTNKFLAHESCLQWKRLQSLDTSQTKGFSSISFCPKTRRQLLADEGRFTGCDLFHNRGGHSCYVTKFQSTDKSRRAQCCYDKDGELTRGPPCAVTNRTKSHQTFTSAFTEFRKTVAPYLECCVFADAGDCSAYQTLGILSNDTRYLPPSIGATFGDPHFFTFDSFEYTFNGYGDYTILHVSNSEFLLQGRMQPLKGGQGVKSPATVFTAFAMAQRDSSTIQVHRDTSNSFVLLIDGKQRAIDFHHDLQSRGVSIRNSSRGDHLRLVIAFDCGITVYVENAAVLQLALTVPVEFKEKTRGLLGYWNDNTDKEYLLPNGEFLSTASNMSQVHHHFGQQWTVSRNEFLFTYGPEENYGDYFVSGYVPTFMEAYHPVLNKMKDGLRKRALTICERSLQCVFDIAVTGRMDIGKDTMEFQKWLVEMKRNLHDEGPPIKCKPLYISITNGSFHGQGNKFGDRYTFKCDTPFLLVGDDEITCGKDGEWSGQVPRCQRRNCSQLTIENSQILDRNNGKLVISCNEGYYPIGQRKISCSDGLLNGTLPSCVRGPPIKCKPLYISITNGSFHGQGNKFGDRYTFKCDTPFLLVGDDEITCGKDGEWSGQVPRCQRRNCSQLTIENSQILDRNNGKLVISCNEGYYPIGQRKISCSDGLLNGTLPSCVREKSSTAPARQKVIIPGVVIGVVISIVALLVIAVTVCLVCKHRKRKATEEREDNARQPMEC
ncbi:protein mesh-like [Montipora foliosa]|uniref:protein mesh-like n=1 Tax=Montipora foliosa TaxID=591990 RepID=UPI0035F1191B